ncbi:hypothetical protein BDAP_001434 [Binucleata daphniae]
MKIAQQTRNYHKDADNLLPVELCDNTSEKSSEIDDLLVDIESTEAINESNNSVIANKNVKTRRFDPNNIKQVFVDATSKTLNHMLLSMSHDYTKKPFDHVYNSAINAYCCVTNEIYTGLTGKYRNKSIGGRFTKEQKGAKPSALFKLMHDKYNESCKEESDIVRIIKETAEEWSKLTKEEKLAHAQESYKLQNEIFCNVENTTKQNTEDKNVAILENEKERKKLSSNIAKQAVANILKQKDALTIPDKRNIKEKNKNKKRKIDRDTSDVACINNETIVNNIINNNKESTNNKIEEKNMNDVNETDNMKTTDNACEIEHSLEEHIKTKQKNRIKNKVNMGKDKIANKNKIHNNKNKTNDDNNKDILTDMYSKTILTDDNIDSVIVDDNKGMLTDNQSKTILADDNIDSVIVDDNKGMLTDNLGKTILADDNNKSIVVDDNENIINNKTEHNKSNIQSKNLLVLKHILIENRKLRS